MVLGGVEMKKSLFCRTFFYEILEALGYDSVTNEDTLEECICYSHPCYHSSLCCGYAHMFSTFISSGFMTFLSAIWVLILLVFTPYDGKNQLQRLSLLGIFAFLTGCNLGPFLNLAVTINPAFVIFACFSLSALYAPDGHYLYLRGTLMSANLYIGLAVMCGFIVYDTQFIVERARRGDMDYVMHSLNLFVDFVGVFWRLLMILTKR
nr:bax inhibitor 1-like [Penaeus vannamei]